MLYFCSSGNAFAIIVLVAVIKRQDNRFRGQSPALRQSIEQIVQGDRVVASVDQILEVAFELGRSD